MMENQNQNKQLSFVLSNLVSVYDATQEYEKSLQVCRSVYDMRVKEFGDTHALTLDTKKKMDELKLKVA